MLALAIPPLFLHARYNPGIEVPLGSTDVGIELSDLAVLAVALAALRSGLRDGWTPLRAGRVVWALALAFLALVALATLYGPAVTDGYPFASSAVSAATFVEYAALAPAVPLLLRGRADLALVLGAVVAWSAAATCWGALQFLGLVNEFEGRRPGQRETSFLGVHDFAALSASSLAIGLIVVAFGARTRSLRIVGGTALVAGTLGVVLSGALASVGAVALGAAIVAAAARLRGVLDRRRAAALAAIVAVVFAGAVAIRSADLDQFLRFLGGSSEREETRSEVQSYAHRWVLAYIGVRIFVDHPVLGVGWQGSALQAAYDPYLDDARERYPNVPPRSLPSPEYPWGVQNAFVQAAADMGLPGLLALLGLVAAGFWTAARALRRGADVVFPLVAVLWLVVATAELTALGLFAGVPIDALLWLAVGLSVGSRRE